MKNELKVWHAPCGIYCKRCPGVKFYKCEGCRTQKGQVFKFPVCKTYECVTTKGYDFCYECENFPCEMLQPIVNFEIFTPHNSKGNKICEEKTSLYYQGKKVQYGGDPLTLEKKDKDMYKKKSDP
jgi:hypothetical protein